VIGVKFKAVKKSTILLFLFLSAQGFGFPLIQMEGGFRHGFDLEWTKKVDRFDLYDWNHFTEAGNRFLASNMLSYVRRPQLVSENLPPGTDEWTYFFFFDRYELNKPDAQQTLFLRQVGMGYEIYFNGQLLRTKLLSDHDITDGTDRFVEVAFDHHRIKNRQNMLVIRIQGYKDHERSGIGFALDAFVDNYEQNLIRRLSWQHLAILVIFIVSAFFQLVFAMAAPSRKLNQILLVSLLLVIFNLLFNGPLVTGWFFDSWLNFYLEHICLFFLVPTIAMVLDIIGNNRVRPFTFAYTVVWVLFAILYWFFPLIPFYTVFFVGLPVIMVYSMGVNLIKPLQAFHRIGMPFGDRVMSLQGISFIAIVLMMSMGLVEQWLMSRGLDLVLYSYGFLFFLMFFWYHSISDWNRTKTHLVLTNQRLEKVVDDRTLALSQANQDLEELVFMKNRFMSILGHDLQSPLGAINYLVDFMNKNLDTIEKESLQVMLRDLFVSSQSLGFLLENLLNWSFDEEVDFPFKPAKFDPRLALEHLRQLLQLSIEQKSLNLDWDVPPQGLVFADPSMIALIARNLLANAIKFTQKKKTIGVRLRSDETGWTMQFTDQGIGMDPEMVEALMAGKVARKMSTGKWKGTGLGMVMAVNFVHRHGGRIQIESEIQKGTKIIVWIPREIPALKSSKMEKTPNTNENR
jgi:signal transduction histidine kinase